ncbi:hypothetical protein TWF106_010816 [Orbilia oligospora]|uniref:Uncharacterized protein n=1 Tax=Orbilia oligospora TaxID=2813651 RepID=A0A6G1LYQ9_ORBOL|nr:hypothetical protein TWF788_006578 [Orbilia oligospora]KAF3210037.1 hypothetical protein TWF106_010816 [Orbilia oligospora]KAF3236653.1 hypothetical protein TWF192_011346 [Orbilia oligospora]
MAVEPSDFFSEHGPGKNDGCMCMGFNLSPGSLHGGIHGSTLHERSAKVPRRKGVQFSQIAGNCYYIR